MNSVAPAYSVIALILILLVLAVNTLAGMPASVFAQEGESVNETAAEDDASETDSIEPEVAPPVAAAPAISYKIENLPSEQVFSDFVVGPGRFELEIAPGESRTVEMVVSNRMGVPKTFSFTTEDMAGNTDPDEAVSLLGDEVGPYTIRDYITVPHDAFVLQHAERARIPITVSIPADAEPGGFYGTLLTQIVSDDVPGEEGQVVPGSKIVSRIGTLFFVTTPGDIERSLELKEFATLERQKFYNSGPVTFNIVTENSGSVHATPFGELRIFNTLGNEVGYVELPPWYVLPNSLRNKEVRWDREFLAGQYTAELRLSRGYDSEIITTSYTFWVIPLKLVGTAFVGLFVIFILLRFIFSQFEFRRKRG